MVLSEVDLRAATAPTDPPITLHGAHDLTECISAAPKPGCTTRSSTDGHQMLVFGLLLAGLAFVAWRIARGVRQVDRSRVVAASPLTGPAPASRPVSAAVQAPVERVVRPD